MEHTVRARGDARSSPSLRHMTDTTAQWGAGLGDRYRVERELGRGGMATVYLAHDVKHDRKVAVKVLRSDVARSLGATRFLREISLAANLNHPHILPLFDSGEVDGTLFYVMPNVEGQSLRDRLNTAGVLPVEEATRIATEVPDALDYAHRHGVVHRDVKPENIMLQEGHALVADFGIGKALSGADVEAVTESGISVGTPAYMSPEQASGEEVDGRSDIFSLGCVMYEMLVGEQAFTGPTVQAVIAKRFVQTPADVSRLREGVSQSVARAVQRALARHPVDRFDTAAHLIRALAEVESAERSTAPEMSLAVTPFVNRSADPDNEYFSDGLSEDLINALTALPGLQMASRTSAFRFRGSELDIREIGEQLNVGYVLEGSVRRAGSKLRVTAQLVKASSGYQVWSDRYDRDLTDVFEIQDEIVASIVEALMPALRGDAGHAVRRPTANLEAYELYLKGRHYWHQRSPATVRVAIQCFEQTIALDPEYALAYCGLADCYGILRVYGWTPADENREKAKAAVSEALKLDSSLAEAHFSKAFYVFYFERAWREAGPHFAKACSINPQSSLIQTYTGMLAALEGRIDDVRALVDRGTALDPLSPFIHGLAAAAFYVTDHLVEAEAMAQRALDLQTDYLLGLWVRGLALCGLDRCDEGIALLERAVTLSRAPIFIGVLGRGYALAGRRDAAKRLLNELEDRASRGEYVPRFAPLAIHVGLHDLAAVRRELTAAFDEGTTPFSIQVTSAAFLNDFDGDPEIARLLRQWDVGGPSGKSSRA
jgi:eukaryotic-like serine/threonine-protein kinase